MSQIKIRDHSVKVINASEEAIKRALFACGLEAVKFAAEKCRVKTGLLRNSITFALGGESAQKTNYRANYGEGSGAYNGTIGKSGDHTVYIGTNVFYAPFLELGTGTKTSGGRQTPWSYTSGGHTVNTTGSGKYPFLRPAIVDHMDKYKEIIKTELKG